MFPITSHSYSPRLFVPPNAAAEPWGRPPNLATMLGRCAILLLSMACAASAAIVEKPIGERPALSELGKVGLRCAQAAETATCAPLHCSVAV